ncbi:sulfatase [Erythrobacter donghaensis]|uniref:sulfatase n=2 Tax=Erythrobacter donghaensis TaxID=267135 RepID=UPI000A4A0120|nr:sulfatase [Erythrobacter donghaensis]
MLRKILIAVLAVVVIGGAVGWFNRNAIMTALLMRRIEATKENVEPTREVVWDQGPATADAPVSERPPNVVFILFDDFGYNDLSTFGGGVAGGRVPTPNIDKLASQGAIFNQAYSGTSTCAPSRAMLMTGRYPTRTGFEFTPIPDGMAKALPIFAAGMDRGALPPTVFNPEFDEEKMPFKNQGLPGSEVTIAELLKTKGYHTVHIGKWHLGEAAEFKANAQGFDESLNMHNGMYLPEDDPNVVNAKLDFDPIDKFFWAKLQFAATFNGSKPFEPGGYITDWWTDQSLKVIEANRNRPFFLYMAHWGVHTPLQATREDFEAVGDIKPHRLRVYAAMVRALDRSVGRIMAKLDEEGLADNTIVVLSSDNGGAGYVGLPDINAPYRGWKITLFEGGIRVPMFVRWPKAIKPGTRIDTPVAHIDVLPTLASAAGVPLPADRIIDGRDMLPLATGAGAFSRPNNAIFWQSGAYQVVRAGDWKLQIDGTRKKTWLFDLAADPTEKTNLARKRPDKVAELTQLLAAHRKDAVKPLYPFKLASPVMVDKTEAQKALPGDEYVIWPN